MPRKAAVLELYDEYKDKSSWDKWLPCARVSSVSLITYAN
jgi:hypothetical protein